MRISIARLVKYAAQCGLVLLVCLQTVFGQTFGQSKASCKQYDGSSLSSRNLTANYYVEVCTIPNPEDKPALSIVFNSITGDEVMRIYSREMTKPLKLDGIYVEQNGAKRFILRPTEIEWATGARTNLDSMDSKKRKELLNVVNAAFQLLNGAALNHRIPANNSQDRTYAWLLINFMFGYRVNGQH
ncbi:MAG TPA: hypothetical protein VLB68_24810 [Pyrinomonadaceae bacterium]|nr:hypothetical protein [Pyrinomonadaceae bacterium]